MGREVEIPTQPKRIISLVPSQTELLSDLRLDKFVVGITKFCIHPESWFRNKTRVGGTKQINLDVIDRLNPDLIIGNKEENERSQIEELSQRYPVWMSDITTLSDALNMIKAVGEITNASERVDELTQSIQTKFKQIQRSPSTKSVLYLIWNNPYMATGRDTFVDNMLSICGLKNYINESRYPELSIEELIELNPDLVLLSSEPYPFKEKHIEQLRQILPDAQIKLVNGEMFSWYGSRLLKAPDYFQEVIAEIY